jgi:hypothetical protein
VVEPFSLRDLVRAAALKRAADQDVILALAGGRLGREPGRVSFRAARLFGISSPLGAGIALNPLCSRRARRISVFRPNDPKLSDCGGRRSLCGKVAGGEHSEAVGAQAVTPGAVRWSAG